MTTPKKPAGTRTAKPPAAPDSAPAAASATPRNRTASKPAPPAGGSLKVKATALGYYGDERRRPGSVFTLAKREDFSDKWMVWVDARTPATRPIGPNEAIGREHDAILGGSVVNKDDDNPLDA